MPLAGPLAVRAYHDEDSFTTCVTPGSETDDFAVPIPKRLDDLRVRRNDELEIALATLKRPTETVCTEAHAALLTGDGYSVCTSDIPDAVSHQHVGRGDVGSASSTMLLCGRRRVGRRAPNDDDHRSGMRPAVGKIREIGVGEGVGFHRYR
jgi:hypothetical protein